MISRRALFAAAGATALSACAPKANGMVLGLTYIPNVQFSPFYLADRDGLFRDAGLEVTLRHHGVQEDLFGALVSGQETVLFASSDEAMVAASQGRDLVSFATGYQHYPSRILARDATSVRDLAGKRIGLPGRFGSSYYSVLCALHQSGLSEDDVELVDIGYTQVTALSSNQVDAVVGLINNEAVQLELMGEQFTALEVTDAASPSLVGPGLVTQRDRLTEEQMRALKETMAEAERRIAANPSLAMEATVTHVPTLRDPEQAAVAEKVLEATIKLWHQGDAVSTDVDSAAFTRMADFLEAAGVVQSASRECFISV